jgi:hypothetical protein
MADSMLGDTVKDLGNVAGGALKDVAPAIIDAVHHMTSQATGLVEAVTTELAPAVHDDAVEVIDAIPDDQFDAPLVSHHDEVDDAGDHSTDQTAATSAHDIPADDPSASA